MHNPLRLRLLLPALLLLGATTTAPLHAERAIPARGNRLIVDQANMLTDRAEALIEADLAAFHQATGARMAILTIPSLEGDILEPFALRVAEAWGIGDKTLETGLLLLISWEERRLRFEVGNGLEGVLNDARCGDIIRGLSPYFEAGNFEQGILYAIGQSETYITGNPPRRDPSRRAAVHQSRRTLPPLALILFIILILSSRSGFFGAPILYSSGRHIRGGRGFGGGGFGGGGFSGGFGGGGFSGGGASGRW